MIRKSEPVSSAETVAEKNKNSAAIEPDNNEGEVNLSEGSKVNTEKNADHENLAPSRRWRKKSSRKRNKLVPKRLSAKLKQIRLDRNLSQAQILVVVNPNYVSENRARVSSYELGSRVPSLIELWNYAKLADITLEMLVDDDQDLP